MLLHDFSSLLDAARAEPQPQRLLLVFTAAELPHDAAPAHRTRYERGEGGALVPVFCVDKRPEDIADFAALCAEAERFGKPWDVLFVGALGGRDGLPPSGEETDRALNAMVAQIKGGRISSYLTANRAGEFVQLRAG